MDNLRLILLVLGVVVVAAIWAFEAWRRRRNAAARDDPFADFDSDDLAIDELPPWQEQEQEQEHAVDAARSPERVARPAPGDGGGRHEPRPRDLFEEQIGDDGDEPPLGDLGPLVARRDEHLDAVEPLLSGHAEPADAQPSPAARPGAGGSADKDSTPDRRGRRAEAVVPLVDDEEHDDDAGDATPHHRAGAVSRESEPAPAPASSTVVSLLIMARPGRRFVGHQVRAALESVGLRYGEMQIFHFHDDDEDDTPLFSAVNALKPGTFDLARLGDLSTTGVALFMQVPGPTDSRRVFELMLDTARHLAERLGGDLGDAGRRPLSAGRLEELRTVVAGDSAS